MIKRNLLLVFMLTAALVVGVTGVLAGTLTITGTMTASDPTMPVVFISTPNCTGQGSFPVLYRTHPFSVDATGTYNFVQTSNAGFASLYLHLASFNPASGLATCLAASNQNTATFSYSLDPGVIYLLVPFDDSFAQLGGDYEITVTGPGNIYNGLPAGAEICLNPLPGGTSHYSVPAGAPTFYNPDLGTQLGFDLPAGTWYITEFSGDFARVWIACNANQFWIPTNAVAR